MGMAGRRPCVRGTPRSERGHAGARRCARRGRPQVDAGSSDVGWTRTIILNYPMSLEQILAVVPPGSGEEALARQIDFDRLPAHVAVIMDGNGRWAAQRHLPRVEGHRAGIESVREVVEGSARLGIQVLTLYAFSVENWKRPAAEVSTLMLLLKRYLRSELNTLLRNDIRFKVVGRAEDLAPDIQRELADAEAKTASNRGMLFNIALN